MVEGPLRKIIRNQREEKEEQLLEVRALFREGTAIEDVNQYLRWVRNQWERDNPRVHLEDSKITESKGVVTNKPEVYLWMALDNTGVQVINDLKRRGVEDLRLSTGEYLISASDSSGTNYSYWETVTSDLKMINSDAPQYSQSEKMDILRQAQGVLDSMVETMMNRHYRQSQIHDMEMAFKKVNEYLDIGKDFNRGDLDMVVRVMENTLRDLRGD